MRAKLEAAADTVVGSGAWIEARRHAEREPSSRCEAAASSGADGSSAACAPRSGRVSLDHFGIALGTIGQGLVVVTQGRNATGSPWERHQPTLVFALLATELAVMMLGRKGFYARHRSLVLSAFMVAIFSVPSFRRTGVGTALLLERPPLPGPSGAAKDLLRVIAGTRLLLAFGLGVVLLLPPACSLATQLTVLSLTWNLRGYCSLPLLRSPLALQRMGSAAALLELLALPVAALGPPGAPFVASIGALTGEAQSEAVCRATLSFLAVCVGLAPALLSTLLWRPVPASCDAGAAPPKGLPRLLQRASTAAAACDGRLHRLLCGSAQSGWPRALLLSLLGSGYLWVLCKRLAGLA